MKKEFTSKQIDAIRKIVQREYLYGEVSHNFFGSGDSIIDHADYYRDDIKIKNKIIFLVEKISFSSFYYKRTFKIFKFFDKYYFTDDELSNNLTRRSVYCGDVWNINEVIKHFKSLVGNCPEKRVLKKLQLWKKKYNPKFRHNYNGINFIELYKEIDPINFNILKKKIEKHPHF